MIKRREEYTSGFTLIELLIVIVVIAILAAITVVAFNGIQDRARVAKMKADQHALAQAVIIAQQNTGKNIIDIDGNRQYGGGGEAAACNVGVAPGTDLAALPQTSNCWKAYNAFLSTITAASGVNIMKIVDPWGRPYFINEQDSGSCIASVLSAFPYPFQNWGQYPNMSLSVTPNGYTGC